MRTSDFVSVFVDVLHRGPTPFKDQFKSPHLNLLWKDIVVDRGLLDRMPLHSVNWREDIRDLLCGIMLIPSQYLRVHLTDQNFACFLANNVNFRDIISEWFTFVEGPKLYELGGLRRPNQIYAPLEQFLLDISDVSKPTLGALLEQFHDYYVIGLQVRVQLFWDAWQQPIDPVHENILHQIWVFADEAAAASGVQPERVRFLIASDRQQGYDSAVKHFGADRVILNPDDQFEHHRNLEYKADTDKVTSLSAFLQ